MYTAATAVYNVYMTKTQATVTHKATGFKLTRSQVARFAHLSEQDKLVALKTIRMEWGMQFPGFSAWELSATRAQRLFETAMLGVEVVR